MSAARVQEVVVVVHGDVGCSPCSIWTKSKTVVPFVASTRLADVQEPVVDELSAGYKFGDIAVFDVLVRTVAFNQ
jgi:hypothetical protein